MEELLLLVIQGLFELLLEVFGSFPLDTMSYKREREERNWTILKCFFFFVVGAGVGAVSVWMFPHTLFNSQVLRVGNLLIGPVLSGLASYWLATRKVRKGDVVWVSRHFWYSYLACLGLVLVRFAYSSR